MDAAAQRQRLFLLEISLWADVEIVSFADVEIVSFGDSLFQLSYRDFFLVFDCRICCNFQAQRESLHDAVSRLRKAKGAPARQQSLVEVGSTITDKDMSPVMPPEFLQEEEAFAKKFKSMKKKALADDESEAKLNAQITALKNYIKDETVGLSGEIMKMNQQDTDDIDAVVPTQGPTGPPGPPGLQGHDGLVGLEGPPGSQGATGKSGVQGDMGPVGKVGPQGPVGKTGFEGLQGRRTSSTFSRGRVVQGLLSDQSHA